MILQLSASRVVETGTAHCSLTFQRVCAHWLVLRMAFILDSFNGLFKLLFGCDLPDHEFLKHNQEETSEKVVGNDKTSWKSQQNFHLFLSYPALFLGGQMLEKFHLWPDLCGSLNLDPVTQREPR